MVVTFDGTDGEWREMEAPLLDVDPELNIFALANGLDLLRNQSHVPDRTLEWYRDGMERRIRIAADGSQRFRVTAEASRRKNGEALRVSADVAEGLGAQELRERLREVLAQGVDAANHLSSDDLRPID